MTLTHREREVLAYLAHGLTGEQAAARLEIAPSTVKNHTRSAFRRLGVVNKVSAFRVLGWLTPPRVGP